MAPRFPTNVGEHKFDLGERFNQWLNSSDFIAAGKVEGSYWDVPGVNHDGKTVVPCKSRHIFGFMVELTASVTADKGVELDTRDGACLDKLF